jgi:hypothetical protein
VHVIKNLPVREIQAGRQRDRQRDTQTERYTDRDRSNYIWSNKLKFKKYVIEGKKAKL